MILLSDTEKEIVINLLKMGLRARGEVWVFGSRIEPAKVKKFSDLDLAFVGTPALTGVQMEQLKELFSASDLSFRVDICNLQDLPKAIQDEVKTHHKLLLTLTL